MRWLVAGQDSPEPDAPPPLHQRLETEESTRKTVLALLVEDNRADVLIVEEAISTCRLPIQLHVVRDGEKAVQFFERVENDSQTPCPQLLILDLNLPRLNGHEVLQRLRNSPKCNDVPVLVLTSSNSAKDRKEAARLGANYYFLKPGSYDELLKIGEALKTLLEQI